MTAPPRRRLVRSPLAVVLAITLLLVACGGGARGPATGAISGQGERGEDDGEGTRSFEHEGGTSQIPEDPQRVVVLYDGPRLDVALMCSVNVVGGGHSAVIPDGFAEWHDLAKVQHIADVGWGEFDVEAIAALRPDLIVSQPEVEVNNVLPEIAPTVVLDLTGNWWTTADDWKDAHRRLAELYNCEDTVDTEITAVEGRIAALREQIGDPQKLRVSVVRASAEHGLSVYSNRLYSAILGELEVDQPPAERIEGGIEFDGEFSLERLPELDGDVLLVRGVDEYGGEAANQRYLDDTVRANPLWEGLAAVEAGQAHVVTGAEWNATGGFEAANRLLDDLEAALGDADSGAYDG